MMWTSHNRLDSRINLLRMCNQINLHVYNRSCLLRGVVHRGEELSRRGRDKRKMDGGRGIRPDGRPDNSSTSADAPTNLSFVFPRWFSFHLGNRLEKFESEAAIVHRAQLNAGLLRYELSGTKRHLWISHSKIARTRISVQNLNLLAGKFFLKELLLKQDYFK